VRRRGNGDEEYAEPLDATRIHPENYEWARKMAVDALDFDETENGGGGGGNERTTTTNSVSALKEILENPNRLDELDMEAFAEELRRTDYGEKAITLENIRFELKCRYMSTRTPYTSMSPTCRFYTLIKETEAETFRVGKLVACKCVGIVRRKPNKEQLDEANPVKDENTCMWQCSFCKRNDFAELNKVWLHFDNGECPGPAVGVRVIMDNGASGFIGLKFLSDQHVAQPEDRIRIGMMVHARVRQIDVERMRVDLTCRTSDLRDVAGEWRPPRDAYFDYEAQAADEQRLAEKRRKDHHKQTYTQRVISHPQFKNCGYSQAVQLLKDMKIGDVVFRPSSKGFHN
jgi:transcription elongation factor SPT6